MTMNLNDLDRVNELAQKWRRLDELLRSGKTGTSQLVMNDTERYELTSDVAVKILQQLKVDVEKQLTNYGVQPPTPPAREGRAAA